MALIKVVKCATITIIFLLSLKTAYAEQFWTEPTNIRLISPTSDGLIIETSYQFSTTATCYDGRTFLIIEDDKVLIASLLMAYQNNWQIKLHYTYRTCNPVVDKAFVYKD